MLVVYETSKTELAYLNDQLTEPTEEIMNHLKEIYGQSTNFGYFTQEITFDEIRQSNGAPSIQDNEGVLSIVLSQSQAPTQPPSAEERLHAVEDAITSIIGL